MKPNITIKTQKQLLLKQAVAENLSGKMLIQHDVGDMLQPITEIDHKLTNTFGNDGWAFGSMIMNAHNVANKSVSKQTITKWDRR